MEDKTYTEKLEERQHRNEEKLDRFSQYQKMRAMAHKKNLPAPIYKDKNGDLHWLNRKARRRLEAEKRRAHGKRLRGDGKEKASQGQKAEASPKEEA